MSVPPQKVRFLSRLGLKTGISFAHFGLKLGMGFKRSRTLYESIHGFNSKWGRKKASSETQGQSVGSGEKVGRKFSSTGERPAGYRLSSNYFQKFKRMPAPEWAQKMLCIIVPNRRTEFLLSSFREFLQDGYCLDYSLSGSCTKELHAVRKLSVCIKFPFHDFKILYARKLKTLFQKYKLQLTTGIQACICHVLRKY